LGVRCLLPGYSLPMAYNLANRTNSTPSPLLFLGGTSFVGGTGSIWGTLVGALIIAVLTNGLILTGVSDIWQYIIKGLVIIGAVALDRYRPGQDGAFLNLKKVKERVDLLRPGNDHLTSPDGKAQHMLDTRQCAFRFGSYVMMGQP